MKQVTVIFTDALLFRSRAIVSRKSVIQTIWSLLGLLDTLNSFRNPYSNLRTRFRVFITIRILILLVKCSFSFDLLLLIVNLFIRKA